MVLVYLNYKVRPVTSEVIFLRTGLREVRLDRSWDGCSGRWDRYWDRIGQERLRCFL